MWASLSQSFLFHATRSHQEYIIDTWAISFVYHTACDANPIWKSPKWFPKGDLFSTGVVFMQIMTDKIPTASGGGIFLEECGNKLDIYEATNNREPPLHLMPTAYTYSLLTALVDTMLRKSRHERPTAAQALKSPWFRLLLKACLLYTSPSPRDGLLSRMPSSA